MAISNAFAWACIEDLLSGCLKFCCWETDFVVLTVDVKLGFDGFDCGCCTVVLGLFTFIDDDGFGFDTFVVVVTGETWVDTFAAITGEIWVDTLGAGIVGESFFTLSAVGGVDTTRVAYQ